jgi:cytochrome c
LIGTGALSLHDPTGRYFGSELIASANTEGQAEGDYLWPNPVTGNIESKHTHVRRVDDMLVGVGYCAR